MLGIHGLLCLGIHLAAASLGERQTWLFCDLGKSFGPRVQKGPRKGNFLEIETSLPLETNLLVTHGLKGEETPYFQGLTQDPARCRGHPLYQALDILEQ